jgi:hypothetical protein
MKTGCVVAFTTNNISLPERSTEKQETGKAGGPGEGQPLDL